MVPLSEYCCLADTDMQITVPYIKNLSSIDTPALLALPNVVEENIKTALAMVGDAQRLYPHIKTHKCAEVVNLCQQNGIQKYKAATIAECELLASCGVEEVLLAFQPVGPKAARLLMLQRNFPNTNFACLLDSQAVAEQLNTLAEQDNQQLSVYVDINCGQNRTGIPATEALVLIEYLEQLPALRLVGIHHYDGHMHASDRVERWQQAQGAWQATAQLITRLEAQGQHLNIIAGGSPTFGFFAQQSKVFCSPGTFVFWDYGYGSQFEDLPFAPALWVASRVISKPASNLYCLDLGHKAVAAERPLHQRIFFPGKSEAVFISQSEEHLVIQLPDASPLAIGDTLLGLPWHVCPTVALHQHIWFLENDGLKNTWQVGARDRQINY